MAVDAAAPGRARERAWTIARSIPVWGWLVGLVVLSTGIRYVFTRQAVAPWIMVDELIYSELAKSFASGGHFLVRDHSTGFYGYVYPILISPAWAAFRSVPDAYAAAKGINALVMSLAAVPAYFLARRVLGTWWSLAAAALAVAIPSMVYTATLMTENAFYPIFLAVVLVLVVWLERPTPVSTIGLVLLCVLAFLTRQQAIALAPAVLTGPLLLGGWREMLRRYQLMYWLVAAGALLVVILQEARGRSIFGILGAYQAASTSHYTVGGVTKWFLYHLSELDLSVGVVPFAALLVLAFGLRSLPRPQKVFVAAAVTVSFWLVLEVAIFASEQSFRVEERNMFYVAPLFLIAFLVWIERGMPRGTVWSTAGIILAAALPGALPYSSLLNGLNPISDTIGLLPLGSLVDSGLGLDDVGLVVVFSCAAVGLLMLLLPVRYALALPLLVVAYFAVSTKPIQADHRFESLQSLFGGITNPHANWIDRAVGSNANVVAIWTGDENRKFTIWENEIFNRSVGTIYRTAEPLPGDLPETQVNLDRANGELLAGGHPIRAPYVLTDTSLSLAGTVIAKDTVKGMLLYRVGGPVRQVSQVTGVYVDSWSGHEVTYTRFECRGGTLLVQLQSDPNLFTAANLVAATTPRTAVSAAVPTTGVAILRVPLSSVGGRCVVRFHVRDTAVPAVVFAGTSKDTRALGTHFNRFTYRP